MPNIMSFFWSYLDATQEKCRLELGRVSTDTLRFVLTRGGSVEFACHLIFQEVSMNWFCHQVMRVCYCEVTALQKGFLFWNTTFWQDRAHESKRLVRVRCISDSECNVNMNSVLEHRVTPLNSILQRVPVKNLWQGRTAPLRGIPNGGFQHSILCRLLSSQVHLVTIWSSYKFRCGFLNPWKKYYLGERKYMKMDWIVSISITLGITEQVGKGVELSIVIRKVSVWILTGTPTILRFLCDFPQFL